MSRLNNYKTTQLVIFILVLTAIFDPFTKWVESLLISNEQATKLLSYLRLLSTLGLISITLKIIDKWLWKLEVINFKIFKWLIDIPNLNGRYKGELISSFKDSNGNPVKKKCAIEIRQTASDINVYSYYADIKTYKQTSMSYSISEVITKDKDGFFKLYYFFSNEADAFEEQLNNHDGTAIFKYFPDIKCLKGEYYNKRGNIGTINVTFKSPELIGRLEA